MDTRVRKESQEEVQALASREFLAHQDHPDHLDLPFLWIASIATMTAPGITQSSKEKKENMGTVDFLESQEQPQTLITYH